MYYHNGAHTKQKVPDGRFVGWKNQQSGPEVPSTRTKFRPMLKMRQKNCLRADYLSNKLPFFICQWGQKIVEKGDLFVHVYGALEPLQMVKKGHKYVTLLQINVPRVMILS